MVDAKFEDICRKIIGLDRKAKSVDSPEEAAAFAAKAQALLLEHNLSMDDIDETAITSGRVEEEFEAGRYEYQRDLWKAVARLNFCFYMSDRRVKLGKGARGTRYYFKHVVVGKRVNVVATQALATYLEQAIDRAMSEIRRTRLRQPDAKFELSFRTGAATSIIENLYTRRGQILDEERAKQHADIKAAAGDAASGMALAIHTFISKEDDANIDFIHGEGTAARWAAEDIANRQAKAEQDKIDLENYTRWAAANPAVARREERKRKEQEERQRQRETNRYWRTFDHMALREGMVVGETIGLDPQVDAGRHSKIGGKQ